MKKGIIALLTVMLLIGTLSASAKDDMEIINFMTSTSGEIKGSAGERDASIWLTTNGIDAWGAQDTYSAYLVRTPVTAKASNGKKVIIQTTLKEMTGDVLENSSTGVVLRSDKENDGVNVMLRITSYGGIRLTYRPVAGERTNYEVGADVEFPVTVRLEYENETATAYYLKKGKWINTCSAKINLGNQIYGGVGAFSAGIGSNVTAEYGDFKFGVDNEDFNVIPDEGQTEKNTFGDWVKSTYSGGGTAVTDNADLTDDAYTLNTNALNAWGMEDNMSTVLKKDAVSFMYGIKSKVVLEAQLDLRVQSDKNEINANASAGLIFRSEDRADAANIMLRVLPGGGIRFTYRDLKGAKTQYQAFECPEYPITLKLERQGNTISGYYKSARGWENAGSIELDLGNTMRVGFGAFSNDSSNGVTAKISNVVLKTYNGYIPTDEEDLTLDTKDEYLLIEDFSDLNLKNKSKGTENPTWFECEAEPVFETDENGTVWLKRSGVSTFGYVGSTKWTDYEASVDFKMNAKESAVAAFEFIVRARPKSASKLRGAYYYSFSMGTSGWQLNDCVSWLVNDNVSIMNSGAFSENYNDGSIHNLKIMAFDDKISVAIDGKPICASKDSHVFKNLWGCIGIKTSGEDIAFSNITVKRLEDELGGDYDNFMQGAFDSPIQDWYNSIKIPEY